MSLSVKHCTELHSYCVLFYLHHTLGIRSHWPPLTDEQTKLKRGNNFSDVQGFFFFFSVLKETQLKLTEAKRKMFWMAHLTQKGQENHSVLGTAGNRDASTAPALSLCQLAFRLRLRVSSLRWQEPLPPMALPQRPADTLGPQSNQPPGRLSLDPFGPPLAAPIRST